MNLVLYLADTDTNRKSRLSMADKEDRSGDCIQVVVRCRPQNRKEKEENRQNIIDINGEARTVQINNQENPNDSKR